MHIIIIYTNIDTKTGSGQNKRKESSTKKGWAFHAEIDG